MLMLQDSLQHVLDYVEKLDQSINNTKDLLEVLKINRDIKGEQNGVSVAELAKLMDYYADKSTALENTIAQQKDKRSKAAELVKKIKEQIKEEEQKNTSTAGRLTLQLNAAMPVKATFTISYIARNAYWQPYYDLRADNLGEPLKILYKAKIFQTTGINWNQVKLSLSTATPDHYGNAPDVQSWFLGFINPYANKSAYGLTGSAAGIQIRGVASLNEVVVTGYAGNSDAEKSNAYVAPKPVYILNGDIISDETFAQINPNSIKRLSELKPKDAKSLYGDGAAGGATVVELKNDLGDYVAVSNKTLNVNFDIDIPYDVPTNGKAQTASIQSIDAPVLYEHYAVPRLDDDAYLLAKIPSWEKLNLLPGEANIIVEGVYVGKTFIDPDSEKDTLNLTLGNDKRVVIQREKLKDFSSVKFLGSNKLQKFSYRTTIKNNKNETVHIVLKDQFPLSTQKDIEVELTDAGNAKVDKDKGVLTWEISLAPNESKDLTFSYSVKYPKDRSINIY
jgi:DNA-binding transcriptional MerR regulator